MANFTLQAKYEFILAIIDILPPRISEDLHEESLSEAKYILSSSLASFKMAVASIPRPFSLQNEDVLKSILKHDFLLKALIDKSWERIHTLDFQKIPLKIRRIYSMASLLRVNKSKVNNNYNLY